MSQASVEQVIGKLLLDVDFRKAVAANAAEALAAFDLTAEERDALSKVDASSFDAAAGELDLRISKMTIRPMFDRLVIRRVKGD